MYTRNVRGRIYYDDGSGLTLIEQDGVSQEVLFPETALAGEVSGPATIIGVPNIAAGDAAHPTEAEIETALAVLVGEANIVDGELRTALNEIQAILIDMRAAT